MRRRVYIICQKNDWDKGKPQVLGDSNGKLSWVFASQEGLRKAKSKVKELNKDVSKNPVHIRKATLIIEKEIDDVQVHEGVKE